MSGDVQPRKRNKDKRGKKKEPNLTDIHLTQKPVKQDDDLDCDETTIHVQKDINFGGNVVSKVFFSLVFGALICMVGIIVLEHRGAGTEVQSSSDSPWSQMLDGWLEDKTDAHNSHDVVANDHEDDEDHAHENNDLIREDDDDHEGEDDHEDEDDRHDDESGEDLDDEHSDDDHDDIEQSEEHETENAEQEDDEAGIFSGFVQKYIQPSPDEEEVDEEGVFTGFINKYIYTSEAAERDNEKKYDQEEGDEGYDSQDDEDDDEKKDMDDNDGEEDDEQSDDDDHVTQNDDDVKYEAKNRRYSRQGEDEDEKNDASGELDEDNDVDSKESDQMEHVTEDWRKIVYRAPAPREEEEVDDNDDDPSYKSYDREEEEGDFEDKNESEENENDDEVAVSYALTEEDKEFDNAGPNEETSEDNEGAGNTILTPSSPLPPVSQDPLSTPLPRLEEEPPSLPLDRRATLVEPGEVVLPPSDVEESDLGEYEEEEEELSQSDIEPTRESTLVTYEYSPADTEQEEEEKSDNDSAPINDKWAAITRSPQEMNSEDEELAGETGSEVEYSDSDPPVIPQARYGGGGPKSTEEDYLLADITNDEDWAIRSGLDAAEAMYNGSKLEEALMAFKALSSAHPRSPRSLYGVAKSLDGLAKVKQSNAVLESAIDAYLSMLTQAVNTPEPLLIRAAQRCIDRGRFKGSYQKIIHAHQQLINKFPDNPKHRNDLAVTYLMMARNTRAKTLLEEVLTRWPQNGMAHATLGFILKTEEQYESAVSHLLSGIHTGEFADAVEPKNRGKYYYVLGDALQRLGRYEEAYEVYSEAADQGMFKSAYQRSVYNVDRLAARPWWTLDQTTYLPFFSKLERNWKKIRDEALAILKIRDKTVGFQDEAETLVQSGDWKQFELFVRGRKMEANCKRTPSTCRLISEFPASASCTRGQVKFSVMSPGTHVWAHCGPTNCRLRAHLGLVVPQGHTALRVANDTRSWEEGKVLVFDDSFEHEVWHNGTSYRLILIVDVWHPELTASEKKTLRPI